MMKKKKVNERNKDINKNEMGITLVALVVTIIVLLILAGVTVVTLTGDNGILQKTGKAKNNTTDAEIKEQIKLAYQDYYVAEHTGTEYTFQNAIDKMLGTGVATVSEPDSNGVYTVSVTNGKKYKFDSVNGKVEEKKPGIGDLVTKDNYGDYIDLGKSIVGTEATTDDWKILYNDKEEGKVYVMLANYLPNSTGIASRIGLNPIDYEPYDTYGVISTNAENIMSLFKSTKWKEELLKNSLQNNSKITAEGAISFDKITAAYNEKYGDSSNYMGEQFWWNAPSEDFISADQMNGFYLATLCEKFYNYLWIKDDGWSRIICGPINGDYGICPVVILDSDFQVKQNIYDGVTVWSILE